ncbi:hypothetical protein, partial [Streptomyces sp. C1-2]|uniref:hypothetical protein n=1 Tax=Streptomyces sp. C1-2 TaxID=2720022 RepID=UPI003211CCD9
MKITCIGGGPANLYFAILMKLQDPSHELTVHERDPAGSTYGWGVTYWSPLLDRLRAHDPESADSLRAHSVRWSDGTAHVRGRTTVHHGDEGFGIGRHRLLDLLADRAAGLGVKISYEDEIPAGGPFPEADLLVAGDGVHSAVRTLHREHYGSTLTHGRNRYIWLGTTKVFDSFTFAFVETDHGWIWCYGYAYDTDRSTCVVECAPETWAGLGLDRANEADGRAVLEKLFADVLDGHPLMGRAQPDVEGLGEVPGAVRVEVAERLHPVDPAPLHGVELDAVEPAHVQDLRVSDGDVLGVPDADAHRAGGVGGRAAVPGAALDDDVAVPGVPAERLAGVAVEVGRAHG